MFIKRYNYVVEKKRRGRYEGQNENDVTSIIEIYL
jgi:hypothetical protein